jgi:hypothetical protein
METMRRPIGHALIVVTLAWTVVACSPSATPSGSPSGAAAASPPSSIPTAAATPAPSPSARPALAYPDVQSYGTVTVSFTSPAIDPLKIDLTCEWSTPTEVSWLYPKDPVAFGGESVSFDLVPDAEGSGQFRIARDGAAGYGPTAMTGHVQVVATTPDGASGSIRFEDLAPDPETAEPGPLPSPLAEWIRPIGRDPELASLTGTVDWACEPAPATVPTRAPSVSEAPAPTTPPLPALALRDGDRRELGVDGC